MNTLKTAFFACSTPRTTTQASPAVLFRDCIETLFAPVPGSHLRYTLNSIHTGWSAQVSSRHNSFMRASQNMSCISRFILLQYHKICNLQPILCLLFYYFLQSNREILVDEQQKLSRTHTPLTKPTILKASVFHFQSVICKSLCLLTIYLKTFTGNMLPPATSSGQNSNKLVIFENRSQTHIDIAIDQVKEDLASFSLQMLTQFARKMKQEGERKVRGGLNTTRRRDKGSKTVDNTLQWLREAMWLQQILSTVLSPRLSPQEKNEMDAEGRNLSM